jgi:hypothetical protein
VTLSSGSLSLQRAVPDGIDSAPGQDDALILAPTLCIDRMKRD